jgi:DNA-binding response OmpR family regulator
VTVAARLAPIYCQIAGVPSAVDTVKAAACVLVIDDDPSICDLYATLLVEEGYRVETAADGIDGLQQLRCKPDLIVLDLAMPRMDGHEFLRQLGRLPAHLNTPVLVVSAQTSRVWPNGASAVMVKPFDLYALLGQVSGMLAIAT